MFKNKKILYGIISSVVVVLIAVGMWLGYNAHINNQTEEGAKEIVVKVIVNDEVIKEVKFRTDAEFLWDAIKEKDIVVAEDSQYGRFVTEAGGVTADSSNSEWWKIIVNDTDASVGVDSLAIKDKDVIIFKLIVGYDY